MERKLAGRNLGAIWRPSANPTQPIFIVATIKLRQQREFAVEDERPADTLITVEIHDWTGPANLEGDIVVGAR